MPDSTVPDKDRDGTLPGRERKRLALARQHGYLNATGQGRRLLLKAFGLWCWVLKIPMTWFERATPRSSYGSLHLDFLTTGNRLTVAGQAEMRSLGADRRPRVRVVVCAHEVSWEHVRFDEIERFASAAYRAATRIGNYEENRPKLVRIEGRRPARILPMEIPRAASG